MNPGRILLVLLLFCLPLGGHAGLPAFDTQGRELPTLAPLLKEVNPAVVNIATFTTRSMAQNPLLNDPFFRRFFNLPPGQAMPQQQRRTQSAGSGVIIDAREGIVVTNAHVVDGADEIVVGLDDGRSYKATLLGSDPEVDIAVLKLEKVENIVAVKIADSSLLQQGDFVLAIGNPFGLGHSVTSGIVSALGRSGLGIEGYEDFIQTDASINPGNSGGALVNLRGELVGINTAILAPSGGNIGIGFAIPINMARASIDQILESGEVRRGQLGVIIQDLTPALAEAFEIDEQQRGVLIAQVQNGSAAEKAGIEPGDIVISVDGEKVETTAQLRNQIGMRRIGESVKLSVLREGKTRIIKAKIGEAVTTVASSSDIHPFLEGAVLEPEEGGGIRIVNVEPGAPALRFGLRQGDVILSANRQVVNSLEQLRKAAAQSKDRLVLRVQRGNAALFLVLQ